MELLAVITGLEAIKTPNQQVTDLLRFQIRNRFYRKTMGTRLGCQRVLKTKKIKTCGCVTSR
jgi:hypothetical protein